MIWKDVSFFSLDNQSILHVWASFHAEFGHKEKSFIRVTKCEKMDSSLLSIYLTIKNKVFQFELHPHIGEIRTDILVYEKGGVIKHIKHQQESKLSFLICEKNERCDDVE